MTLNAIHMIQADIAPRKTGYAPRTTLSNNCNNLAGSTFIAPKWEDKVRIYSGGKKKELLIFRFNPLPHILGTFMGVMAEHLADKVIAALALNTVD